MVKRFIEILNRRYPQNYLIKKPFIGMLLFVAFLFGFIILYQPVRVHESRSFNLFLTIFFYCISIYIPLVVLAGILKRTNCFSKDSEWTFSKELKSIAIILLGFGITVYFVGFFMEEPAPRWNWPTFFDAMMNSSIIAIIPLIFFTLLNFRYLYTPEIQQEFNPGIHSSEAEKLIQIASQLKKEELKFYPGQFLYAESDGNYVAFHLEVEGQFRKVMIRNSISNIEQQLSSLPFIVRTHRAFIVNVEKIALKKGNSLGYRLKLAGLNNVEIPVSRQKVQRFDHVIKKYR